MNRTTRLWLAALAVFAAFLSLGIAACGGSDSGKTKLSLVAYSTPQEAYEQLIPAFEKTDPGKDVSFS